MTISTHTPFALSLSKGCPSFRRFEEEEGQGFDKLSLIGVGGMI